MMPWPYSTGSDITTFIQIKDFIHTKTYCMVPVHPVGLSFAVTNFKYSIPAARTYLVMLSTAAMSSASIIKFPRDFH